MRNTKKENMSNYKRLLLLNLKHYLLKAKQQSILGISDEIHDKMNKQKIVL